jgi:hypothetical protein
MEHKFTAINVITKIFSKLFVIHFSLKKLLCPAVVILCIASSLHVIITHGMLLDEVRSDHETLVPYYVLMCHIQVQVITMVLWIASPIPTILPSSNYLQWTGQQHHVYCCPTGSIVPGHKLV